MEVLHNSCNIWTHVLPDLYTLIPWAWGPRKFGCTYQAEHSCTTINYELWHGTVLHYI